MKLVSKIKNRIWGIVVAKSRNYKLYPFLYKSYWHFRLSGSSKEEKSCRQYFSAVPNEGAGIGHQIANWIAGYWFARQFDLRFAHIPFSSETWEGFLGFGAAEKSVEELLKKENYSIVRIPLFNEGDKIEVLQIKKIIASYRNRKIIFICEQDQFYKDQYGVMDNIKAKFHGSKSRKYDHFIYNKNVFNIAVHMRRGDILEWQNNQNSKKNIRWQNNDYFLNLLEGVVESIPLNKEYAIYLFSQGDENDFQDFNRFQNIHYCLDMNAKDSFLHMVYADLLITSKSSFSYKPALLSNGIKIYPKDFWHGYPDKKNWISAKEDSSFDTKYLRKIINGK